MKKLFCLFLLMPLNAYSMETFMGKISASFNFATNRYAPIQGGGSYNSSTETTNQHIFTQGGTLNHPWINVTANTIDVRVSTVSIRKNAAEGNEQIYFPAGTTGTYSDDTNSDTVAANDKMVWHMNFSGTSGAATVSGMSIDFTPTVVYAKFSGHNSNSTTFVVNGSSYCPVFGEQAFVPTEANSQLVNRISGTAKNFNSHVVGNTRSDISTITFRINGADATQHLYVNSGTTGFLVDSVNTDALNSGDLINYNVRTDSGTGTFTGVLNGIDLNNSNNEFDMATMSGSGLSLTSNITRAGGFNHGIQSILSGTDSTTYQRSPFAFTASNLRSNMSTNVYTNISTVTFRLDGTTDGNLQIYIPASTTGQREDSTHTDSVSANQIIGFKMYTSITGSSSLWNSVAVKGTYPSGATGRTRRMFSIQ